MSSKNPSTKKSVNRARKANGLLGIKSKPPTRRVPNNGGNGQRGAQGSQTRMAPTNAGNMTRQSQALISSRGQDIRVKHREYIGDLNQVTAGSIPFSIGGSFPINPGQRKTFPWLSRIAQRFESYNFRNLVFEFMTESATTAVGYVGLIPDMDATDPAPNSKQQAFQYQGAVKSALWENVRCVIPQEMLHKQKSFFVRRGALPAGQTLNLTDVGNLFAIMGTSAAAILGELWVSYDVDLMTPQLEFQPGDSFKIVGNTAITRAAPLGTAPVITQSVTELVAVTLGTTITFGSDFQGILEIENVGTAIVGPITIGVSTATASVISTVFDGGALNVINVLLVSAVAGQTVVLNYTANSTTITGTTLRGASYDVTLL